MISELWSKEWELHHCVTRILSMDTVTVEARLDFEFKSRQGFIGATATMEGRHSHNKGVRLALQTIAGEGYKGPRVEEE